MCTRSVNPFTVTDPAAVRAFVEAHPFGTLIAVDEQDEVVVGHAPFVASFDARGTLTELRAHFAQSNPVARLAAARGRATVLFEGPNAYVSATWYGHPDEEVPTWNYLVATARGRVSAPMPRPELTALLDALAAHHEAIENFPWSRDRVPAAEIEALLDAIVGLTLHVERIEVRAKVSQNRSPEDRIRVARVLAARGGHGAELAAWMHRLGVVDP